MSIARLARPAIQALRPYEAAVQVNGAIRLNANEAPWNYAAAPFRRPLNRYPEIRPTRLQSSLAHRFDCPPDQLLVTRGTSEAIDLLIRTFCRAGKDNIVTTAPTFSMYAHYAQIQGAAVRSVRADPDENFAVDATAILNSCDESTRLIFLCSPNNPTGTCFERASLEELLEQRKSCSAVVVDEAYIEFSTESSVTELLRRYDNLIVLRTLSKALAFAGARCGAVMGPLDVISMLDAVQAPYAMATPVVECVENVLRKKWLAESSRRIREIVTERERLISRVHNLSCVQRVWPSQANFFLAELNNRSAIVEQMRVDKVLLRYFRGELANCVRITVGTIEENNRLLRSLAKINGKQP